MAFPITIRCLLLGLALSSAAQAQAPAGQNPLTGDAPRPAFQSENTASNLVLGAISASAIWDDNIGNSARRVSGEQFHLAPSIAFKNTREHLKWNMGYSAGLRTYLPTNVQPVQFNQSFGGTLNYDLSKRFSIRVRQDYLLTTDPFDQLGYAPLQPAAGLLKQPGTTLLPRLSRRSLLSEVEINYHLGRHTTAGLNGTFTDEHYGRLSGNNVSGSLINHRAKAGSLFLFQQFTARQTAGLQYQILRLEFPQGPSQTITHSLLLFDRFAFSPHMSFSVFAGPEYSRVHDQVLVNFLFFVIKVPVFKTSWSPAAGGDFTYVGDRMNLTSSFLRRISDGGGYIGSVEMNNATLKLQRKLGHRWAAGVSGDLTIESPLTLSKKFRIRTFGVGGNITHELTANTKIQLTYRRLERTGYTSGFGPQNHNQVLLTLNRKFERPIGR